MFPVSETLNISPLIHAVVVPFGPLKELRPSAARIATCPAREELMAQIRPSFAANAEDMFKT